MKKELLLMIFLMFSIFALADGEFRDSVVVEEVQITATRNRFFQDEFKTCKADSTLVELFAQDNLQNVIQYIAPVQVINYGSAGSLSSIRLRGGTGNHTLVNWNGFPVNSLTTGSADVSMLSMGTGDEINITFGGAGSIYGNGAVGGVIDIDHVSVFEGLSEARLTLEGGSFSHKNVLAAFKTGSNTLCFSMKGMFLDAENDFPFADARHRDRTNFHNGVNSYALLPFLDINGGKAGKFGVGAMLQRKHKEIPVTMNSIPSAESSQNQTDSVFRVFAKWNWIRNGYSLAVKTGFFSESMLYTDKNNPDDDYYKTYSHITTKRFYNDLNVRYFINNSWSLDLGGQYSKLMAKVAAYGDQSVKEDDYSLILASRYCKDRVIFNVAGRLAGNSSYGLIPVVSVGGRYKLVDSRLVLRASAATRYRQPTFNDRYWQPYGNPDLNPEKGYNIEMAAGGKRHLADHQFEYDLTAYYSQLRDWIEWIPVNDDSQGMAPRNNKKVETLGVEAGVSDLIRFTNGFFKVNLNYAFNRTININKQSDYYHNYLRYMPLRKVSMNAVGVCKKVTLGIFGNVSSQRYVSDANLPGEKLPTYLVINFHSRYQLALRNNVLSVFAKINNVFNTEYQEILNYQMPGRAYYVGMSININNKRK